MEAPRLHGWVTVLPERTVPGLKAHLVRLRALWQEDFGKEDFGKLEGGREKEEGRREKEKGREKEEGGAGAGVYVPEACARKNPGAGRSLEWQWLFPTKEFLRDPATGVRRRHHMTGQGFFEASSAASWQGLCNALRD